MIIDTFQKIAYIMLQCAKVDAVCTLHIISKVLSKVLYQETGSVKKRGIRTLFDPLKELVIRILFKFPGSVIYYSSSYLDCLLWTLSFTSILCNPGRILQEMAFLMFLIFLELASVTIFYNDKMYQQRVFADSLFQGVVLYQKANPNSQDQSLRRTYEEINDPKLVSFRH